MIKFSTVVTIILGGCLVGCATQLLSDDRIRSNTAGAIGVSPEDVTISNRREQMPNTYYNATTKAGVEYACIINGGGFLAAGMVNPPMCSKKGEPIKTNPFSK